MRPAIAYAIDRIRALAPPNGDQRMNLESRQGPMAQSMNAPGPDPMLSALDRYWAGLTGQGEGSGWFGMNTVPQELMRLKGIQDEAGAFSPEYMAEYIDSPIAPGFGVMAGTTGKVGDLWSDLSKTRLTRPISEMSREVAPAADLLPRQAVRPEDLQGSILQPLVGDRTAAGETLLGINDNPLAAPVRLEGGPDFMRDAAAQADNVAWASGRGVVNRLQGHVDQAANRFDTDNINLVYSPMSARSGDFSTMMSDALLGQLPTSRITKATKKGFDAEMRQMVEGWPGIDSPKLGEFLRSPGRGEARKTFVELVALGKYQSAGFPDIGSTRFAITTPELIGQPTGMSGYGIARAAPGAPIIDNPAVPHTTYDVQMPGQYMGGLETPLPRQMLFPDFYEARRAAGYPAGSDDRAFSMSNVQQIADQKWLDRIMSYLETTQQ